MLLRDVSTDTACANGALAVILLACNNSVHNPVVGRILCVPPPAALISNQVTGEELNALLDEAAASEDPYYVTRAILGALVNAGFALFEGRQCRECVVSDFAKPQLGVSACGSCALLRHGGVIEDDAAQTTTPGSGLRAQSSRALSGADALLDGPDGGMAQFVELDGGAQVTATVTPPNSRGTSGLRQRPSGQPAVQIVLCTSSREDDQYACLEQAACDGLHNGREEVGSCVVTNYQTICPSCRPDRTTGTAYFPLLALLAIIPIALSCILIFVICFRAPTRYVAETDAAAKMAPVAVAGPFDDMPPPKSADPSYAFGLDETLHTSASAPGDHVHSLTALVSHLNAKRRANPVAYVVPDERRGGVAMGGYAGALDGSLSGTMDSGFLAYDADGDPIGYDDLVYSSFMGRNLTSYAGGAHRLSSGLHLDGPYEDPTDIYLPELASIGADHDDFLDDLGHSPTRDYDGDVIDLSEPMTAAFARGLSARASASAGNSADVPHLDALQSPPPPESLSMRDDSSARLSISAVLNKSPEAPEARSGRSSTKRGRTPVSGRLPPTPPAAPPDMPFGISDALVSPALSPSPARDPSPPNRQAIRGSAAIPPAPLPPQATDDVDDFPPPTTAVLLPRGPHASRPAIPSRPLSALDSHNAAVADVDHNGNVLIRAPRAASSLSPMPIGTDHEWPDIQRSTLSGLAQQLPPSPFVQPRVPAAQPQELVFLASPLGSPPHSDATEFDGGAPAGGTAPAVAPTAHVPNRRRHRSHQPPIHPSHTDEGVLYIR